MAFGTDRLSRARARVEERPDGLHVRIPARRHWLVTLFFCFWVTIVVLIAGLVFLVAALLATGYVIWALIGREDVTVGGGRLEHVMCAGPVRRRRSFDASRVEEVRHERRGSFTPYMFGMPMRGGSIAFDYGHRTHHVGLELDDAEAKHLARLIGDAVG